MDSNGSAPPPRRRVTRAPAASADPAELTAAPAAAPGAPAVPTDGEAEEVGDLEAQRNVREGVSMPEATLATLELHRGAIGRLDAQEVEVRIGAIGAARAEKIEVELGSIGAALANELEVTQGAIGTVLAGEAHLDQVVVRTMIARTVVVERPSLIGFMVARRVSGDVRVLFDWRGAIVFGLVVGLVARVGRRRR